MKTTEKLRKNCYRGKFDIGNAVVNLKLFENLIVNKIKSKYLGIK